MKFYTFLGGNKEELIFEEMNMKFLVHKDLLNEGTKNMILDFVNSGVAADDINVTVKNNIYRFEPSDLKTTAQKIERR